MCHVYIPVPTTECNKYVLQTYTDKSKIKQNKIKTIQKDTLLES